MQIGPSDGFSFPMGSFPLGNPTMRSFLSPASLASIFEPHAEPGLGGAPRGPSPPRLCGARKPRGERPPPPRGRRRGRSNGRRRRGEVRRALHPPAHPRRARMNHGKPSRRAVFVFESVAHIRARVPFQSLDAPQPPVLELADAARRDHERGVPRLRLHHRRVRSLAADVKRERDVERGTPVRLDQTRLGRDVSQTRRLRAREARSSAGSVPPTNVTEGGAPREGGGGSGPARKPP